MWHLRYQHGWGTRGPRSWSHWYFTREPTEVEILAVLNKAGIPATAEWLMPQNGGLILLDEIEVEF